MDEKEEFYQAVLRHIDPAKPEAGELWREIWEVFRNGDYRVRRVSELLQAKRAELRGE